MIVSSFRCCNSGVHRRYRFTRHTQTRIATTRGTFAADFPSGRLREFQVCPGRAAFAVDEIVAFKATPRSFPAQPSSFFFLSPVFPSRRPSRSILRSPSTEGDLINGNLCDKCERGTYVKLIDFVSNRQR